MANCTNCGAKLTCGCQRKTASDGKQGCVQCIPAYEQKLKKQRESGGKGNNWSRNNNGLSMGGHV